MPRLPRLVVPGAPHHVTQRGNNRQPIFTSDVDRHDYLDILRGEAELTGVTLLAWCLMTNHVHLIAVPAAEDSLPAMIQHAHSRYAVRFNRRSNQVGHLWQNRFYSCALSQTHLFRALHYIELNPVRAGLSPTALAWPWSSAAAHTRPHFTDYLLDSRWPEYFRGWDYEGWRESLAADLPDVDLQSIRKATSSGGPFGDAEYVEQLEVATGRILRPRISGRPALKRQCA